MNLAGELLVFDGPGFMRHGWVSELSFFFFFLEGREVCLVVLNNARRIARCWVGNFERVVGRGRLGDGIYE